MTDADILALARKRMQEAVEFDRQNREDAMDDMEFIAGRQWPEDIKQAREGRSQPVITINRLPQFVRQVTGDIRKLNPAIRIIPGDNKATEDTAETIGGLVRAIEYASDASSIYEGAAEQAAACGMGAFRILAEYADDDAFDQEIRIQRIPNPFAVYWDPVARDSTRQDAQFCFVTEQMRMEDFKEAFPGFAYSDADADWQTDGMETWHSTGSVLIAEYFWKEPVSRTIGKLANGTLVEDPKGEIVKMPMEPTDLVQKRTVQTHKVMWAKISGRDILDGPTEMPCKHIPIVAVMGEEMHVGEELVRTSVIRYAKDSQRLYNYWKSTHAELVALQPRAPYLVTAKQVAGLEDIWKEANTENRPYLPYNPDEKAPGAPQRAVPPQPSTGIMQEAAAAAEDMKATTGIYDSALGQRSNETSGVAIRQRQMEADVSTSIYTDNLAKAIAQCGRILVSMIPKIYDTRRVVRIVGDDDQESAVEVNGMALDPMQGPIPVNPLTVGKYDVRVTVGPNYSTRRQETAESMMQFIQALPAAGAVAGDLIAKAMDWPDKDKLAERLKKILPPGMIDPEDMDPQQQQAMQQGMQAQQAQMVMQQQAAQVAMAKDMAEAEEAKADAQKAQFEAQRAGLELQLAQLQARALMQPPPMMQPPMGRQVMAPQPR
jgi:hypothetical protein